MRPFIVFGAADDAVVKLPKLYLDFDLSTTNLTLEGWNAEAGDIVLAGGVPMILAVLTGIGTRAVNLNNGAIVMKPDQCAMIRSWAIFDGPPTEGGRAIYTSSDAKPPQPPAARPA